MTDPRVVAVGGAKTFPPLVARVMGSSPDDIVWLPSVAVVERTIAETAEPFDVVVLAPTVSEEDAASVSEYIARQAPMTAVIVARDAPVDGAFPRLVRSGARDVVDLSRGGAELKEALQRAVEWTEGFRGAAEARAEDPSGRQGVIVAVFSTKGGTGKTFLSCNLAAAIAEVSGRPVGLLDLDHDLGDVFAYFGANPRRSLQELLPLGEGASPEEVMRLGTPLVEGVTGFGSPPDPRAEPIPGGAMTKMLRLLKNAFAVTIVDATSEYSDHVLAAFDMADAICLITGLDAIGVRHMSIGLQTLQKLGVPRERLRIVLNRADSKVDLTPADIERLLGIRVNARIPSSSLVPRSVNRARLLWVDERRSDVAGAIETFARELQSELIPETVAAPGKSRRWRK
jgi:pilus assembly protein CpaE